MDAELQHGGLLGFCWDEVYRSLVSFICPWRTMSEEEGIRVRDYGLLSLTD